MPTINKITSDAEEYKRKLADTLSKNNEGTGRTASMSSSVQNTSVGSNPFTMQNGKTVYVDAKVSGLGDVKKMSYEIAKLPESKTLTVKSNNKFSMPKIDSMKTDTSITVPAESMWGKMTSGVKNIWKEITNLEGGSKKLLASMASGFGPVGVALAAIGSVVKLVTSAFETMDQKAQESVDTHLRSADSISEAANANERSRAALNGYFQKLSDLASLEQMNNGQKLLAASLVEKLSKSYDNLGISIDAATGKITGLDQAIVERQAKDKDRRLREISGEIKELQSAESEQQKIIDSAGVPTFLSWNGEQLRIGGEAKAKEASEKMQGIQQRIREKRVEYDKVRKKDDVKEYITQRESENENLRKNNEDAREAFSVRKADDEFNSLQNPKDKVANRQKLIDAEVERRSKSKLDENIETLKQRVNDKSDTSEAGKIKRMEAEKQLLQLQVEQQKSEEKIYQWKQQIAQVTREQVEASRKEAGQSKSDQNGAKSGADGKKTPETEKDAARKKQDAQNALNLQNSMRDQGKSLLYGAMEQAGMGPEAAYAKALEDAEKTKGAKLTPEEIDRTKQLTDMSLNLSESTPVQLGDLGIRSNDLTARGGFASGAVMPERDEVNRAIRSNTQFMADALKGIQTWLDKLDNSIKEGNRN